MAGTYNQTVYLTNYATQNPFTVGTAGVVSVTTGGDGIVGSSAYAWTVVNEGTIASSLNDGVRLKAGGDVVNGRNGSPGGLISAFLDGVYIYGGLGETVTNYGTIAGGIGFGDNGVRIKPAGAVGNSGTISGYDGVYLFNDGTVVNSGLIAATHIGVLTQIGGGTLANSGTITGQYGVRLGSLGDPGTLSNAGVIVATGVAVGGVTAVVNTGTIVGGTGVVARYAFGNYGTQIAVPIVNRGLVIGTSGAAVAFYANNSVSANPLPQTVTNYGTLSGGTAAGTAVAFGARNDVLLVEPGSVLAGALAGFTEFDTIDLASASATGAVFSGSTAGGTLSVLNGTAVVDTFLMAGRFAANGFTVSPDGNGGVDIKVRSQPSGTALNGTYYQTVYLTNAATENPLTAGTAGLVSVTSGDGIVGTAGYAWTLFNGGTVASSAENGVRLTAGGAVTNGRSGVSGGLITGSRDGVAIYGGSGGTVSNYGRISGGGSGFDVSGVVIQPAGTVTNFGRITGYDGVLLFAGGTVLNSGVIASAAYGVLAGGGSLTVVNSGTIRAIVDGVRLFTGRNHDTLTNSGTITAGADGVFGGVVTNTGTIAGSIGIAADLTLALYGPDVNRGVVIGTGGPAVAFYSGGYAETVVNYGTLIGGTGAGTAVAFGGGTAADTLVVEPGSVLDGTLTGFSALDTIDLASVSATGAVFSGNSAGGTLTVMNGTATVDTFLMAGQFAADSFTVSPDGNGGTDITTTVVCFCRGTLILTERGEVPVEDLRVGDRVRTLSGALKAIKWIGFGRDLVTGRHSLARPIIVAAGALGDGVPSRDLYLTHGHALYLDGALIPVAHLVNHETIRWDETAQVVEYYHVELDAHDVLVANGAPAESYYDADNRALFHNARPGSTAAGALSTFAPVLTQGEIVERAWQRLFDRAGGQIAGETTADPDLHLVADGVRLDPVSAEGGVYAFALPRPPAAALHLVSRSAVPSLTGQGRSDHRRLGVALSQIVLSAPGMVTCLDHAAPLLVAGGCHRPELGHVWTDGDLALPAALFAPVRDPATLVVHTKPQALSHPPAAPPPAAA